MDIETAIWALWGLWMLQAAFCACNIWVYPLLMDRQDRDWQTPDGGGRGRAVVVVPIKGITPLTDAFLGRLFHQDHPDYRVIFCFESEDDPAAKLLRGRISPGPGRDRHAPGGASAAPGLREVVLLCAGPASDCGQKIHNQLAAMRSIGPADAFIAFADADMLCASDWLSRLLAPLERGRYDLAGGYRWFIPRSPGWPGSLASVMNASVATLGGRDFYNMLWGGSMALTREVYEKMNIPELFKGSLNDDLHLAREARIAGYRIGFVRSLLIPSPVSFSASSLLEFARRQYYQARHHSPKIYTGANVLLWLYPLGWASSLAAALSGHAPAWIPWIAVNLLFDQARALGRARLARRLFDAETIRQLRLERVIEHVMTPIWMTAHALLCTSALAMSRVSWSGITYRIHARRETEILARGDAAAK